MDAINAFIVRRQSAHERSPSNATRKDMAINLEATRWPYQRTQQERHEGDVSVTTILIQLQQISPQGHQSPQSVHNEHKLQRLVDQRRSQGLYARSNDGNYHHCQHDQCKKHKLCNDGSCGNNKHDNKKSLPKCKDKGFKPWCLHSKHANHLHDECCANPHNQACEQQQQVQAQKKREKTKPLWYVPHASHAQQSLDKQQIKSSGRASDTVFSDKRQARAMTTKKLPFL